MTEPASSAIELPPRVVALVPMRNLVLFPNAIAPVSVGRAKSIAALERAIGKHAALGILLQKDPKQEDPTVGNLHLVGTLAEVTHHLTPQPSLHHAVCQGTQRFRVVEAVEGYPFLAAKIELIAETPDESAEAKALALQLRERALELLSLLPSVPAELMHALQNTRGTAELADITASVLDAEIVEKQSLLETVPAAERVSKLLPLLSHRIEVLRLSREIGERTKEQLDDRQRKFLLREQLKTIQKELGEAGGEDQEIARLGEAIAKAARRTLEADHFGLERVKQRIVEFLAVRKPNPQGRAPILCFVGPPGVGKNSLGQSIARALQRPFVRVSLGGVHDEAEIRGHRRTCIGALPGNIVQGLRKAGARDCVMMRDEVDKLTASAHGDPSAALLEVLDPEQNSTFRDYYLGVPFARRPGVAGSGKLTLTGQLGDVMKDSAQAAITLVKSRAAELRIDSARSAMEFIALETVDDAIRGALNQAEVQGVVAELATA